MNSRLTRRPKCQLLYWENVLHPAMEPLLKPCVNQCIRCSELPCVNVSGCTWPRIIFWM